MPVPVGIGAGDFIAVAKLAKTLASELREIGEAGPEYQALLVELEALERALCSINNFRPAIHEHSRLEALRAAVMICQRQLQAFLNKMSKFDKALGVEKGHGKSFKKIGRRVQWTTAFSDDVKALRATLDLQLMIINILMSLQLLESSNAAELDRKVMTQISEDLRRDSQRLLEFVKQQQQETLKHREDQHSKNVHAELNNVKPKIDDLLSQVNGILKAGPVKYTPPTATARLRNTFVTAATTAALLRIFAGTRNPTHGRNTAYPSVNFPQIGQATSSAQWVWDDIPGYDLTPSTIEDYLKTLFPKYITLHVERDHDRFKFWIPRLLEDDEKDTLINQRSKKSDAEDEESDSDDQSTDSEDQSTDAEDRRSDSEDQSTDSEGRHPDSEDQNTEWDDQSTDSEDQSTDSDDRDSDSEYHDPDLEHRRPRLRRAGHRRPGPRKLGLIRLGLQLGRAVLGLLED